MRALVIHSLLISLAWRTAIAYDSCNIDDYHSSLIVPASHKTEYYQYLDLPGICDHPRGDSAQKFNQQIKPDTVGDLDVFFPDNRTRPIRNQFNQAPYCLAFIINNIVSEEPTVLIWGDEGEPLLSIGTEIQLMISGTSVNFNSTFTRIVKAKRLQICTNGTHATYYIDCREVETKPFVMTSNSGIKTLSVIAKRNLTTFKYDDNLFNGAVQQLYSVQCGDPLVDLRALSSIQCRSVPKECSKEKKNNLTDVLREVCDDLPKPPVKVLPFCDIVAWRNSPNVSIGEIGGYDVRLKLTNRDISKEVIRHTNGYEAFMVFDKDEDVCFKQSRTTVEIRVTMPSSHFASVGLFSEPVNLGCIDPDTPCIHFELNGKKYVNNTAVSMAEVGEGENALICKTNKRDCCAVKDKRFGEFYYPNGVKVPIYRYGHGFYRNRGYREVRLNRKIKEGIQSPTGVYCCVVLDACEVEQKICIELKA